MLGRVGSLIGLNLLVAAGYFGAARFGLSLAFVNDSASAVWPPTGLSLAAVLLLGPRIWPGIVAGAFLANWVTTGTIGSSALIATGNTLEALLGAALATRFAAGARSFSNAQDIIRLIFFAAIPSTALSATCGVVSLALHGLAPWQQAGPIWLTWWLGDLTSDLTLAPLVLIWFAEPVPKWSSRRWAEAAFMLVIVVLANSVVFMQWLTGDGHRFYPTAYFALPLLLWGAFRFHLHGAVTVAAVISSIALYATLVGRGAFAVPNPNTALLLLQGFMGVCTVTTLVVASLLAERQKLLEREQRARADAEAANRSKDQFLAVLSHELRTPLTPIQLTASVLSQRQDLPADVRDDLRAVSQNVELEARLIDDLLDLTRISRGKLNLNSQAVDLHALVRNAIKICARDGTPALTVDLSATRHFVRADAGRIQQVVWNLLSNAQKFTPSGGSITVWSCNGDDGWVQVGVTDSGEGIEPELVSKIFLPFAQGDSNGSQGRSGLGLGLAISKSLIDAHGGRLSARSEGRGRGATFVIELPTVARPATLTELSASDVPPESLIAARHARPHPQHALCILVVEDDVATLAAMQKYLASLGHRVTTAATVADALDAAGRQRFDVIISDLGLPDGSGYELMERVRASRPIFGIALSGYGMDEDVRRSLEAGFAEHITKPVDAPRLLEALGRAAEMTPRDGQIVSA